MDHKDVEDYLAQAAQLPPEQEVVILRQLVRAQSKIITELLETVQTLKQEVADLKRQLYGRKSEKRHPEPAEPVGSLPTQKDRGKAPTRRDKAHVTDKGLRFTATSQVITIDVPAPAEDGIEIIDYEIIHRVAQRPAATVVLAYKIPIVKSATGSLLPTWAPNQLWEGSYADVSFIAGMLTDKFLYHLPLYRQHQRLKSNGIDLARSTLTSWSQHSIALLKPIYDALIKSILTSSIIEMDETPIKASRKIKGKMHTGYFWPILGDQDEIAFMFANTRATSHIQKVLKSNFTGTLLTDGYGAYQAYAKSNEAMVHANCWAHWRRLFFECKDHFPEDAEMVLDTIASLYAIEARLREESLPDNKKREIRLSESKPIVEKLFDWCEKRIQDKKLTPKSKLRKALQYGLNRVEPLKVFLEDPALLMDTNQIERQIRPIAMGKRSWLFCWTEVGAEQVGIIQSLIASCKLSGVDPYTYLVDVLFRVGSHPARQVHELTPRYWKNLFADQPYRSDLWGKGK